MNKCLKKYNKQRRVKYTASNPLPAPYRRKLDLKHSIDLTLLKGMLEDKEITIDIYIKRVWNIYDFEALKQKEKKTKQASAGESDSDLDYSLNGDSTGSDIDSDLIT